MPPLTDAETRALARLDTRELVESLVELVDVPSVSGSDAESDIQQLLAKRARDLDLDVDLWQLDLADLTTQPDFPGWEAPRTEGWGLVATSGPGEPELVLQGHVDVVPAGDLTSWHGDPFRATVTNHRVLGRGTCDMKAGVAANLAAVRAVRRAGLVLERPYALHFVIGEEDGGLGAFATLRRGHGGRRCIITEPTSGTITTASAGALTFRLEVPGAATHASTSYAGVSAFEMFLPLHAALAGLERRRNLAPDPLMDEWPVPYPLSIGTVHCGDWASSVPDLLVAEGRLGVRLDEDPADARAELEDTIALTATTHPWLRHHPPTVTWPGGQFASGRYDDSTGLRSLVAGAHADVTGGPRPRERGAPYGSDLRLYAGAGIPTLHYGPGDVRLAHGPHEAIDVDELVTVTESLVLALVRACTSASA